MRENLKSEKGAITLIVLVGMLFLTTFLISMYIATANKAQDSAETTKQIQEEYNNLEEANAIYDSYFADKEIIPIYTREQLEKIGSGEQITIDGKIYTFTPNGYYILKNDLDLGGYYNTSTNTWEVPDGKEWTALPSTFIGILDGLGHTITGLYINDSTASNQGLFGTLKGTVKNLNILGSYIKANESVGAIAGLNEGTIQNCNNKATVIGTNNVGGIAGNLTKNIVNCTNTGTIVGQANVTGGYFKSIETGETIDVWGDKVLEENAYFVSGRYTATAPKGFKVSKNVFEQTIEQGMVIQDAEGNEFVWVPVAKPIVTESEIAQIKAEDTSITTDLAAVQKMVNGGTFPMAVQVGTDYKGLLYNFSGTETLTATVYDWTSESGYREPASLTGKKTWEEETTINGTTIVAGTSYAYDSQEMFVLYEGGTYTDTLYQNSYNNMVKSVDENGGFFVGRYEMSIYTDPKDTTIQYAQSKANQTALGPEWYKMYKYERDYAKYNTNLGVASEMIWGSQWDQMMIFVNGKNDGAETPAKFYVAQHGSRKSGSSSTKTGMNKIDKVANIFDLEAGSYEWTQEAQSIVNRAIRGGYYGYNFEASICAAYYPVYKFNSDYSSRVSLYVFRDTYQKQY